MDGIDAVLAEVSENGIANVLATHSVNYDPDLAEITRNLAKDRAASLVPLGEADRRIGAVFAKAALALLEASGFKASAIAAIGSHGQTVQHSPHADANLRFSLQIGDPATIAELTGISTVADFRRQDIAAGGQGAPLVPLFHASHFGSEGEVRAVVNIGGISNATLLDGKRVVSGFDCGPGNTLLDSWTRRHKDAEFDADGAWSAENEVDERLLSALLQDEYFQKSGPRSTGPEYFNLDWVASKLASTHDAGVVQATLAELTAAAIADSVLGAHPEPAAVFICGGGARNIDLMRRLHQRLAPRGVRLGTTDEIGIAADWVEACAFAWLAHRNLAQLPGNAPTVTGATGDRVLGARYEPPQSNERNN